MVGPGPIRSRFRMTGAKDTRRGRAVFARSGGITHDCAARCAGCVLEAARSRAYMAHARGQLAPLWGKIQSSALPSSFQAVVDGLVPRLIVALRADLLR